MDHRLNAMSMYLTFATTFTSLFLVIRCDTNESQLAAQHFARVLRVAKCDRPMPRVLYLSKIFPQVNKKYIPFATILHVCDSSSGCCSDERFRCSPKNSERITLHFITYELTDQGNARNTEALTFDNHTKCHCKHINR